MSINFLNNIFFFFILSVPRPWHVHFCYSPIFKLELPYALFTLIVLYLLQKFEYKKGSRKNEFFLNFGTPILLSSCVAPINAIFVERPNRFRVVDGVPIMRRLLFARCSLPRSRCLLFFTCYMHVASRCPRIAVSCKLLSYCFTLLAFCC